MKNAIAYTSATIITGMLYIITFGIIAFVVWTTMTSIVGLLVDFNLKDLYILILAGLLLCWINKTK